MNCKNRWVDFGDVFSAWQHRPQYSHHISINNNCAVCQIFWLWATQIGLTVSASSFLSLKYSKSKQTSLPPSLWWDWTLMMLTVGVDCGIFIIILCLWILILLKHRCVWSMFSVYTLSHILRMSCSFYLYFLQHTNLLPILLHIFTKWPELQRVDTKNPNHSSASNPASCWTDKCVFKLTSVTKTPKTQQAWEEIEQKASLLTIVLSEHTKKSSEFPTK